MEWWMAIKEWFMNLGEKYNVNPIIFGSIYLGAIPFFFASVAWLVKSLRKRKSIIMPVMAASFFFISAYLYLIIAGRNIPVWVYIFISLVVAYGVIATVRKVKAKAKK